MTPDLAANTAVSFATTTTWQAYGGENTLLYLAQSIGLTAQNFLAGAAGLASGFAFIRGFARERSSTIGNFWVDLIRSLLWVLLPLALIGSLVLIWQGVLLNVSSYTSAHTLESRTQFIAQGPVAALEFIKNLGTNGGGFFNANGAHPYANPTPLANFLGLLAIAVLPASLMITLGHVTGRPRAGWTLLGVMVALFVAGQAGLVTNSGSRGFTEILFAYASCMANNGQTMAGLNANSSFYNVTTAIAMTIGRFGSAALALALAGRAASERHVVTTAGTLPNDTLAFAVLVFGTILLLGALSFFPALALGPIVEFLQR